MSRKFKPGSHVTLRRGGMPMMVTMYADRAVKDNKGIVCVTWTTLDNKTRTAKYHEDELILFTGTEWNGRKLGTTPGDPITRLHKKKDREQDT